MSTQAKVTSTEALEKFRAALIVFLAKSKRALDDSGDEVRRMRQWVEGEQMTYWMGEYRRRTRQLERATQELMSAKLSNQRSAIMAREMALTKAKNALEEAEDKIGKLRRWSQNFESATDPIIKRIERLRQVLGDLPKAIAYLSSIQKTLEEYSGSDPMPDSFTKPPGESSEDSELAEAAAAFAESTETDSPENEPAEEPPLEATAPDPAEPTQK